jgi:threonine dehydratase
MSTLPVTIEDIRAAAVRIKGHAVRTPLLRCEALDAATGARVFVKAECLQRGGAFKFRGAMNAIASMSAAERASGILAYSSGNHAIAVATVSRLFGVPAVIVMPSDAPRAKLDEVRAQGGEVVLYDRVRDSRESIGAKLSAERGLHLVPPFNDVRVIAGQGTAGLEIGEEIAPDIVLTPASGGGLAAGTALSLPNARVYPVEPEGHDDVARSLESGRVEMNAPGMRSICDALMSPAPGDITFAIGRERWAGALAMPDATTLRAMRFAFERLKLVVEPGGAIALAAALEGAVDLKGATVAIIASGGNVDAEMFARALGV